MVLVDANIIIRIAMNDNPEMVKKARDIIDNNIVLVRNEVLAEIVYVLLKVYDLSKERICGFLLQLIENSIISVENDSVLKTAIKNYEHSNLDFVDCLLYAYSKKGYYKVVTFDKKLQKLIAEG